MTDSLSALSQATATHAQSGAPLAVRIATSAGRSLTGSLWRQDLIVTSEQSLPRRDAYEIGFMDGAEASAKPIGRDPGTNSMSVPTS